MVQKIVEDENNSKLKISLYISNLNMYSCGKENGKWIYLPSSNEDIRIFFKSINAENEEYIILEHNSPYQIGEYENIYDINAKLKKLNQLFFADF